MAFGIRNTYLSQKKYNFTQNVVPKTPAPQANAVVQAAQGTDSGNNSYINVKATVTQGGGKDSYLLPGYNLIFRRTANSEYIADIPSRYAAAFSSGATFSIGCGCGGRKKTILQII